MEPQRAFGIGKSQTEPTLSNYDRSGELAKKKVDAAVPVDYVLLSRKQQMPSTEAVNEWLNSHMEFLKNSLKQNHAKIDNKSIYTCISPRKILIPYKKRAEAIQEKLALCEWEGNDYIEIKTLILAKLRSRWEDFTSSLKKVLLEKNRIQLAGGKDKLRKFINSFEACLREKKTNQLCLLLFNNINQAQSVLQRLKSIQEARFGNTLFEGQKHTFRERFSEWQRTIGPNDIIKSFSNQEKSANCIFKNIFIQYPKEHKTIHYTIKTSKYKKGGLLEKMLQIINTTSYSSSHENTVPIDRQVNYLFSKAKRFEKEQITSTQINKIFNGSSIFLPI